MYKLTVIIISLLSMFIFFACEKAETEKNEIITLKSSEKECLPDADCAGCPDAYGKVTSTPLKQNADSASHHLVTFIELGSVNCIPCKKMQPVIKSIEEKYGEQIKVIFYDVWKPDQKKYAQEYGIRLIPTQVFLDKDGNEIFRHEGFYPEQEIDAFLQKQGLKPLSES